MLHVFEEVNQGRYEVVSVAEDLAGKKEKDGKYSIIHCTSAATCIFCQYVYM